MFCSPPGRASAQPGPGRVKILRLAFQVTTASQQKKTPLFVFTSAPPATGQLLSRLITQPLDLLGRFGTRGERYDVSLFQIALQAFELLVIPDFRHVCDAAPIIGTNFEEERMSNLLSKMNSYAYCI